MNVEKYEVFISSKSEDYSIAKEVYDFLIANGIKAFFADNDLNELGASEYSDVIDNVIDSVTHMIVVGSKIEYIESKWVKTEWRAFTDEQRAGRKSGNILTILDGLSPSELPLTLRNVQSFNKRNYRDSILQYLTKENDSQNSTNLQKASNLQSFFVGGPQKYIPKIIIVLTLSFVSTIILATQFVNSHDIYWNINEENEVDAKILYREKLDSLDVNIRYLAGQMDSAYNVARRLSIILENNPITELEPMEEGTLEYKSGDKSDYVLCKYYEPTEIDTLLFDYVKCIWMYNDDSKEISRLIGIKHKIGKEGHRNYIHYHYGITEDIKALFRLCKLDLFILLQELLMYASFCFIYFLIFCSLDRTTNINKQIRKYLNKNN